MKAINNKATQIFNKLISLDKTKVQNNDSFMAVHIEMISEIKDGKIYSLAHYYEQNGDLMADPEMEFLIKPNHLEIYPLTFRQDNLGMHQQAVYFENGRAAKYNPRLQKDFVVFANEWLNNISLQQSI